MKYLKRTLLAAALPAAAIAAPPAPTVSFKAPTEGGTLVGNYFESGRCEATGTNIARVDFFLDATKLNTDSAAPWHCGFNSKSFPNGPYVLKAVAYDKRGRSATTQINVTVSNNLAPSVSLVAPAAGATVSGLLEGAACEATASDADGSIAKVDFFLGSNLLSSASAAPYQCAINTATYANGQYTLMAMATDNAGATATVQRSVTFQNADAPASPAASPINPADIIGQARADTAFAQQSGYTAQVIGTYTSAAAIPESGIHGSLLANGETLRFGKEVDPLNSLHSALAFQVAPSDPNTSGAKRAELSFAPNIAMEQVYWVALSVFVHDWGTLSSSDQALFGLQLHSGDNSIDLSPAFSLTTTNLGRNFKVSVLHSTSTSPSQANTVKASYADQPIPFGRWVDFVFRFRQSTAGSGFVQVWMDGAQIVEHQGNVGFQTGSLDYMKFGYYNWSGSAMASRRKVVLRSPTIVADPSGKYTAQDLRAHIQPGAGAP